MEQSVNEQSQPIEAVNQPQNYETHNSIKKHIPIVLIVLIVVIAGTFTIFALTKKNYIPNPLNISSNQHIKSRNILLVKENTNSSGGATNFEIDSYNLETKKINKLKSLPLQIGLQLEAKVSPDGNKYYYFGNNATPNSSSHLPTQTITVTNKAGVTKTYIISGNYQFGFNAGSIISGSPLSDGYWSPDSSNIAFVLNGSDSKNSTGGMKIELINTNSGQVSDVFKSSDNPAFTNPSSFNSPSSLIGWLGNNKLLVTKVAVGNEPGVSPTIDFYSIDINTKQIQKLFSHTADISYGSVISLNGNQVFFGFSNFAENSAFGEYNISSQKYSPLVSNSVVVVRHPTISDDGTKLLYVETSSTSTGGSIYKFHIYDIATLTDQIINIPKNVFWVNELLPDNKTYIMQTGENSIIYDSQNNQTQNLDGFAIGSGYF